MAFNTIVVNRGGQQFRGAFSEIWLVKADNDFASLAAGAETNATITVPGLALGDMVISYSTSVNFTSNLLVHMYVSAADTLNVVLSNTHASSAVDLADATFRFVIGRPSF